LADRGADPYGAGERPDPWTTRAGDPFGDGERPDPWADRGRYADGPPPRNGALPPPGAPRPRSGAGRPPTGPPEVAVPYPTSPDLGVRSLTSAELPTPRSDGRTPSRRGRPDPAELAPDALPPAPPGAADDVRLSIFEDLRSEWFTRREDAPASPSWRTPADDGWQAAARLAEPTTAGTTTAGLPKRKPQALYVPGAVTNGEAPNGVPTRSPQEVRGRLSSYRDGVRRGRHAERPEDGQDGR
jgi:hypothetical protein